MNKKNKKGPVHTNPNPSTMTSAHALALGRRGRRPVAAQLAGAPQVAAEVRAATEYDADFPAPCPRAEEVASSIETAAALSAEEHALVTQLAEVARKRGAAWDVALANIGLLARMLDARGAIDAAFARRYPALGAFVVARSAIALRSAAAKRKAKRDAEAAKEETPTPTAPKATPTPA